MASASVGAPIVQPEGPPVPVEVMAAYDRLRTLERKRDRIAGTLHALKREHAAEHDIAQAEFYLRCVRDQVEIARREWDAVCPPRRGPSTIDYRALAGAPPRRPAVPPRPLVCARISTRPRERHEQRRTRRSSSSDDSGDGLDSDSDGDPAAGGALNAACGGENERIASALQFAALGCLIAPAAGKDPGGYLGKRWQRQATRDPDLIAAWWEAWPTANVAILPERALLPVDVDDPSNFERFQADHGQAPRTPRYLTGGGDRRERLLFAFPGDEALEGVGRKLAPGVQLRHSHNTNLVCVAAWLEPDTGRELQWLIELDEPLAQFPPAWRERANAPKPGKPASHWAGIVTRQYVTGCGDTHPDVLSLAAWKMRNLRCGEAVLELLLCWNNRHCTPPKPIEEVESIVAWVARQEAGR